MKIAIDNGSLSTGDSIRGIGVYVRELTKRIKDADVADVSKTDLSKYDLIHFTRFNPFRVLLPFNKPGKTKYILTIYDLIPLIYPKHYPPGLKGRINWETNKLLITKNIDAIITISETSKKDICRFLGITPNKVFVTYLASPDIFTGLKSGNWKNETQRKYNLPEKFALYVGDVNFNKNIPSLIKACRLANIKLVMAGKQASEIEKMDLEHPELSHLKGVDWNGVLRLGFVPDEDLVRLYSLASVYVQSSYYEGFSLPPLQAYKCGTPLVISKNQCHVEVFGSDFHYFDPYSIDSLVDALKIPNTRQKIPRDYSWEKTSKQTLEVYEKVRI